MHTGFPAQEDNLIAQRSTAGTINFNWPTGPFQGDESVFISAATGSFEAEEIEIDQNDLSIVGNSSGLTMNGTGLRRITTQPINTDFPDEVILNLDLSTGGIPDRSPDPSNAIVVQFSTDGGATFNDMTDTNDDNQWLSGSGNSIEFILTSGQKSANTIFRIVQENSNSFVAGEEPWSVSNNINLEVGGIVTSSSFFLGDFSINPPNTQITAFNDGAGDPTTNYFAGQTVEIDATFTGAMDQVDEFSYTAVFRNGDR